MQTPYNVKLSLFRGAAIIPHVCLTLTVLASSKLEALNRAETEMNVVVDDDEYAAATEAKPVWGTDPRAPAAKRALALAA
ncbi:MAG: hypothetical protein JJU29_23385 [Verrucomicrobia bacterium]|nr:hypothetical protein [Verrucomicrobiota bacterium]MCH8512626.1 hypothetical protein [Kiritimatiellia bacterium]